MSNDNKKTALPKLRFPEFRDEPGWPEMTLAENLFEHRLKSDGKSEVHSVSVHKGIINQVEHLGRSFSAADTSKYNLVKPFDIVYTKSPTGDFPYGVVKQNLTGQNVIVSPLYGVFKPTNKYVGNLIHAYFEDPGRTNNYLVSLVQKGAKNTIQISNDRFLSKEIYLPNNEGEQQKIAAALSSLDDLITAQGDKLEVLQAHKRGLMQGLFPAEGESVPKLRFSEFREADEWKTISVDDLIKEDILLPPKDGNHGNIHPKASDYVEMGIPFIMANDLRGGRIDFSRCTFIPKELSDNLQKGFAKDEDVLITHKGTVGEVSLIRNIPFPYLMLTPQVTYYRVNDRERLSNDFLAQAFISDEFQKRLKVAAGGGTRDYIGIIEQRNLKISMPFSVIEQKKIAATLSSLDDRITAQLKRIEVLKLHKKGLMQDLFPATPEPTA